MRRVVIKSNVNSKWSNKGGRLSSKVMTTSSYFMGTSKYVSCSTINFSLLMWLMMLFHLSILTVKNLCLINKMLDKLLVSLLWHEVLYIFIGHLHPLICANFLSTKLMTMMEKAFLNRHSYIFWISTFTVDSCGYSKPFTISQRSLVDNTISNLNL
jgi:hypothetical protein